MSVEVSAYNIETRDVEAAWFKGASTAVPGHRTHFVGWNGSSQAHRFALRSQKSPDRPDAYAVVTYSG